MMCLCTQVESVFSDLRERIRGSLMKEQADMNQGRGSFELSVPLLARGFHLQFDVALESCGPLILAGMCGLGKFRVFDSSPALFRNLLLSTVSHTSRFSRNATL